MRSLFHFFVGFGLLLLTLNRGFEFLLGLFCVTLVFRCRFLVYLSISSEASISAVARTTVCREETHVRPGHRPSGRAGLSRISFSPSHRAVITRGVLVLPHTQEAGVFLASGPSTVPQWGARRYRWGQSLGMPQTEDDVGATTGAGVVVTTGCCCCCSWGLKRWHRWLPAKGQSPARVCVRRGSTC